MKTEKKNNITTDMKCLGNKSSGKMDNTMNELVQS